MKVLKTILLIAFLYAPFCNLKAQLTADFKTITTASCTPFVVQFFDASTGAIPVSWKWNFGDGQTSVDKNPLIKFAIPGTYSVTLTVSDGNNTSTTQKTNYIAVYPQPEVNRILVTDNFTCAPSTQQISARIKDSQTVTNWLWYFGDGDSSYDLSPQHTYISNGSYTIQLKLKNIYGCEADFFDTAAITVRNGVNVNFDYTYQNICSTPSSMKFTGNVISDDSVYLQWYFGDGKASNELNPTQIYNVPGSYDVKLIGITYPQGCADTVTKTIKVGFPSANFALPKSSCLNARLVFTDSSSPKPLSENWNFGDGGRANGANVVHTYTNPGTYTVVLTADFGNCVDTIRKKITISARPKSTFSVSENAAVCSIPQNVTFTNASSGATSYQWDFGDGSTNSTNTNETHAYTKTGIFSVSLIATNSLGCSDTSLQTNIVNVQPFQINNIGNGDFTGCAPKTFQFNPSFSSNNPVTSYSWDFGDGTTSASPNPSHSYTYAGNYNVKLIAANSQGCRDTFLLSNAVKLGIKPTIKFNAMPRDTCANATFQFIDQSTDPVTEWRWNFGDGVISDLQNPQHTYSDTGNFTIRLTEGVNGCLATIAAPKFIHVKPPIADFSIKVFCNDYNSINFKNNSIGGEKFLWLFDDKAKSTESNPVHFYKKPGSYNVSLTASSSNGCSYTKSKIVTVLDTTGSLIRDTNKIFYCKYDTVHFTLLDYDSANIKTVIWNFGDDVSVGPLQLQYAPDKYAYITSGIYNPLLIINNIYNCPDSFFVKTPVNVYGPTASFSSKQAACTNANIVFNDFSFPYQNIPIKTWKWNYGDGNIDSSSVPPYQHKYTTPGNYTVKLKITDSLGCYDSVFSITQLNISTVNLQAGNDTTICKGTSFMLQPSGADVYNWQSNPTLSCNDCNTPVASPAIDQIYYLTGSNIEGCIAKDSIKVHVQQPFNINVNGVDSLCAGNTETLTASGSYKYAWIPSDQSATLSGTPVTIKPLLPVSYTVVGTDSFNCFHDTARVSIPVFPQPQIKFNDSLVVLPAGSSYTMSPFISDDITFLQWTPLNYLSCTNCQAPVASPYRTTTYTVFGSNVGNCTTKASITLQIICKNDQVYIPNTFSPNNDGMNDVFYPRGRGVFAVRSFKVFNRIGQLVFENHNFSTNDPSAGWNGKFKGTSALSDVYIYIVDIICDNNEVVSLKGNVTLLR